jgi:hypothetical protein
MSNGYVRQSATQIAPNQTITSAAHNDEYNALEAAFDAAAGHNHDGSVGAGAKIPPQGLAGSVSTGLVTSTSPTTFTTRSLVAGPNILISNPDGVSGNITVSCSIANAISIPGNGIMVATSPTALVQRSVVAGTGISVSNGDGVAGNIVITATGTPDPVNSPDILLVGVLM